MSIYLCKIDFQEHRYFVFVSQCLHYLSDQYISNVLNIYILLPVLMHCYLYKDQEISVLECITSYNHIYSFFLIESNIIT